MGEPEEQASPVLVASVHDVRPLATILRGLNFSSRASFTISDAGLTVCVEESKTLIARAYIPFKIFDECKYVPETDNPSATQDSEPDGADATVFDIPLDTLLECLNIFGTATSTFSQTSLKNRKKKWRQESDDEDADESGRRSRGKKNAVPKGNATIDQFFSSSSERKTGMRMTYAGAGHPLTLILAEDAAGPTTTCEIETMECETGFDIPFDNDRKVIKIILKSSWLRDAVSELDPSCDKLTFIGTPASEAGSSSAQKGSIKPMLRLSAEGTFGSTQMDYPNDREVLETFECADLVKFSYRVEHVSCALGALKSSSKTSLRIDDEGVLSLQFQMAGVSKTFIDFRCLPLLDDI